MGHMIRHRCSEVALTIMGCMVLIAACGTSGSGHRGSSTPYGPKNSPATLSRCMRENGVSNFPDPIASTGGVGFPEGLMMSPDGSLTVDGSSFSGPALKSAEKACKEFLPGGGRPPPPVSATQKAAALANARCMRKHGVPDFPDPTFPSGGGTAVQIGGPGVNPQSPAFKEAAAACGLIRR